MEKREHRRLCQIPVIRVWLEKEYPRKEEERPMKTSFIFSCKLEAGGFKVEIVVSCIDCYEHF